MIVSLLDRHVPGAYLVRLPEPDDFELWRERARALVQCGISPEQVAWAGPESGGDLFAGDEHEPPRPDVTAPPVRASKAFVELARNAILHSEPARFALLYRLLWRLQSNPKVMEDPADRDVRRWLRNRLEQEARVVVKDQKDVAAAR